MKIVLVISIIFMIIPHWVCSSNVTSEEIISVPNKKEILLETVIRSVKNYIYKNDDDSNTFVGRCIGLAKKVRQILPIAVFLMGVILTLLGFLTIFSMKTLGLVGLLLLINTSGIVAKLAATFASHKHEKRPSTVHFHVHKDDDHHGYHIGHSGPGPGPEWDRMAKYGLENDLNKIESYNLYNKLLNSLAT